MRYILMQSFPAQNGYYPSKQLFYVYYLIVETDIAFSSKVLFATITFADSLTHFFLLKIKLYVWMYFNRKKVNYFTEQ